MNRLIDEETSRVLNTRFAEILEKDVNIKVYTDGHGEYSDFTLEFMKELAELTPKVKPVILPMDDGRKAGYQTDPTLVLGEDLGYRLVFNGTPAGHEANTIIESVVLISAGMSGFSPNDDALLKNLDQPVHLQVFVTTSCPYCPQSASVAFKLAMANPKFISAEIIEAQENQELALKYDIKSVPLQLINSDPASVTTGVLPLGKWILQILKYGYTGYETLEKQLMEKKDTAEKLTDHPETVVTLTDSNMEEAINKYPKLVIDCWTEWCGPCRMMSPVIDELAGEHSGRVVYGKLNVDENPAATLKFKIESIPSVLLFLDGVLTDTLVGARPKEELQKVISEKMKLIIL